MVDREASRRYPAAYLPPGSMKQSQVHVLDVSALVLIPQDNQRTISRSKHKKILEQ
jgi:hypothetical protein